MFRKWCNFLNVINEILKDRTRGWLLWYSRQCWKRVHFLH